MNTNRIAWTTPVIGLLLLTTVASAQVRQPDLSFTNRLTLSAQFGVNISGRFKNVGSGLNLNPVRRSPNGKFYNYADGYVLPDSSGNRGGQTWYWGYDNASQVNSSANSIAFHRDAASSSDSSCDDSARAGIELTYDYELGVKEDWHHLRYGVEGAVNWMPIEFSSSSLIGVSEVTDTYKYTPGTTPPSPGYQGPYGGPGFLLNVPAAGSTSTPIPGAMLLAHEHFDANLVGFHLGPYVEYPLSEKLALHFAGGLAVGVLDGDASWQESYSGLTASGGGSDTALLWGYYLGFNATYQFTSRWGVEAGLEYQNLGTYNHNYGGCMAELDLSKSLFIQAGVSFSF